MNWDRVQGNWKKFSGSVRERWGKLTDNDLEVIEGRRETLSGRIQEIYGISQDEAERQIKRFVESLPDDKSAKEYRPSDMRPGSGQKRAPDARAPSR